MSGLVRDSSCDHVLSGLTVVVVLSMWESSRRRGGRVAVRLESTSYWCTYQRHCGNAGSQVTGGRTSGIVECWAPRYCKSGHPPQGDQPEDWRAPSQRTVFFSGISTAIF